MDYHKRWESSLYHQLKDKNPLEGPKGFCVLNVEMFIFLTEILS